MAESQIHKMLSTLILHWNLFKQMSKEEVQWVVENPKKAIGIFRLAVKNHLQNAQRASEKFFVSEHFRPDVSDGALVKIGRVEDFDCFYRLAEDIEDRPKLSAHEMAEPMNFHEMIDWLGGNQQVGARFFQIWSLLMQQGNGEEGELLTNGGANIFFINYGSDTMRVVVVYWVVSCWYVHSVPLGVLSHRDSHKWEGGRVFSQSSLERSA